MLIELLFILNRKAAAAFTLPADAQQDQYRYISIVTKDPYGIKTQDGRYLSTRRGGYADPPSKGYEYDNADSSIYYWDDRDYSDGRIRHNIRHYKVVSDGKFHFEDVPQDHRLKPGETVDFTTCVVDTLQNNKAIECFDWNLNHRGQYNVTDHYIPHDNSLIENTYF